MGRNAAGVALVLALLAIVLAVVIVVGFLSRVGSERVNAARYGDALAAETLAASAVNLVQAQINEATSQTGGRTGRAWVTQPGAIRVYDADRRQTIRRLYSAATLTTADPLALAADLPADESWRQQPALWTDLNAPVAVGGAAGTQDALLYPVLDPRDPLSPGDEVRYLDAKKDEWDENWGFAFRANAVGATAAAPRLPVRWLYVLQSGTLAAPAADGATGSAVRVPGASAKNPVVGRIAFWTDDETCKVNVNTAAGSRSLRPYSAEGAARSLPLPAPWDVPRFKIPDERLLFSENQPLRGEYQRYPGHPATTDLYNIRRALGWMVDGYPPAAASAAFVAGPLPGPDAAQSTFFAPLPRYTDAATSLGGSRNTTARPVDDLLGQPRRKADRLYSSLGETLYDPDRQPGGTTRRHVEAGKFFLTTHSRAPEATLYGTPRVATWPLDADPTRRSLYDQAVALCATPGGAPGGQPLCVQRANAAHPTQDWTGIARNRQLYGYLQALTAQPVPGSHGSLLAKYADGRDQILTEMFDYVRTVNLSDHGTAPPSESGATTGGFTGRSPGQVVPLKINGTRGLGRVTTLSEIGLLLICTADGNSPLDYQEPVKLRGYVPVVSPVVGSANDPLYVSNLPVAQLLRDRLGGVVGIDNNQTPFPANKTLAKAYRVGDPGKGTQLARGEKRLQAMLLLEPACPMQGYDPLARPRWQIEASGLQGIALAGQHPFPERTTTGTVAANQNGNGVLPVWGETEGSIQNYGGVGGFRWLLMRPGGTGTQRGNLVNNGWSNLLPTTATVPYRFISDPFTVDVSAGGGSTIDLGGGCTVRLQIPPSTGVPTVTYQTFEVEFPALGNLPTPDLPLHGIGYTAPGVEAATNVAADWWNFDNRIRWLVNPGASLGRGATAFQPYTGERTDTPLLGPSCVIRADFPEEGVWTYAETPPQRPIPVPTRTTPAPRSDVVRSLVARDGDYRLTAALDTVDARGQGGSRFVPSPGYFEGGKLAHLFMDQGSSAGTAGVDPGGTLAEGARYAPWLAPKVPSTLAREKRLARDWDTGLPWEADGAYANKPDEGNTGTAADPAAYAAGNGSPYYLRPRQFGNDASLYHSPQRIVPSPVMFGSLPTGVAGGQTWRTLCFRPHPDRPAYANPPGPADHAFLDLFTMPVVEPYAISEPCSTAGKINLNYQIQPFTYLRRSTGVRAVLASELVAEVGLSAAGTGMDGASLYKGAPTAAAPAPGAPTPRRLPLALREEGGTLQQFEDKFRDGELFVSASEICDVFLVPRTYRWPGFRDASEWYGDRFVLVGDNVRERPYADLYPRLTTRSNTFTVHYRVQVLRSPDTASADTARAGRWDETRGSVVAEVRGSTVIERFLDPARTDLPDYTAAPFDRPLDQFYQWRIVGGSRFPP